MTNQDLLLIIGALIIAFLGYKAIKADKKERPQH